MMAVQDAVDAVMTLVDMWGGEESISGSPTYVDEVRRALESVYELLVREYQDEQRTQYFLVPAIRWVDVSSANTVAPPDMVLPVTLLVWLDPTPQPLPPARERQYGILQYDETDTNVLQSRRTTRRATGRYRVVGNAIQTEDASFLVGGPAMGRLYYVAGVNWQSPAAVIPLPTPCCWELVFRAATLLLVREPRRQPVVVTRTSAEAEAEQAKIGEAQRR